MSEQMVDILDQALKYSLWAFLAAFIVFLSFIAKRLRDRRRGLSEYMEEEFNKRFEQEILGDEATGPDSKEILLSDRIRMVFHAMVLSILVAVVAFLVTGFTPISLFENFATVKSWQTAPLRVTSLSYERTYQGFSLKGEVWNQSEEPTSGLKAVVQVWKSDRELLEEKFVPVRPARLAPDSGGTFSLEYTGDSPLLYGYRVLFQDDSGAEVAHVKGFDVH